MGSCCSLRVINAPGASSSLGVPGSMPVSTSHRGEPSPHRVHSRRERNDRGWPPPCAPLSCSVGNSRLCLPLPLRSRPKSSVRFTRQCAAFVIAYLPGSQAHRRSRIMRNSRRMPSGWPNDPAAGLCSGGLTLTAQARCSRRCRRFRIRRALLAHRGRRPAALAWCPSRGFAR
jgi:hypothetical protein